MGCGGIYWQGFNCRYPKDFDNQRGGSAEQGYADAQFNLGLKCAKGEGTPKNDREAVKWYRKAAEQGIADAQYNLALRCASGEGALKDFVASYAWYNLAAFSGAANAAKGRESIAKEMTAEQIAKAQEMSRELLKQIEARKAKQE